MTQTVLVKRSDVANRVPTTAQLELGELAVNTKDGKLFFKVEDDQQVESIVTLESAPDLDWSNITNTPNTLSGYGITDAYTKGEVDGMLEGIKPKHSVKAATTENITLSGTQTVDGVALVAGDRVLVKDQTNDGENGIYDVVDGGAWTRSADADEWKELVSAYLFIEEGTVHGDEAYVCVADQGGTLDSTSVTWVRFHAKGGYALAIHTHTISQITDIGDAVVASAGKLTDEIDFILTGDITGTAVDQDLSGNVTISTTLSNVDGGTY